MHQRLGTKEGEKDIYRMARIRERKTRDINQINCNTPDTPGICPDTPDPSGLIYPALFSLSLISLPLLLELSRAELASAGAPAISSRRPSIPSARTSTTSSHTSSTPPHASLELYPTGIGPPSLATMGVSPELRPFASIRSFGPPPPKSTAQRDSW